MLRKRRLLRYKYAKALLRRQLWDRDPSHNTQRPTWGWKISGPSSVNDGQNLSWNNSSQEIGSSQKRTEQKGFDEFAHFKAWVDKDPFGALFGDRLQAISRCKSREEHRRLQHQSVVSNVPPTSRPSNIVPSGTNGASQASKASAVDQRNPQSSNSNPPTKLPNIPSQADEYEFDPISMRKVLKPKTDEVASVKASRPLFDPLFAEKGVDIPVKPYKPHRVFGYPAKSASDSSDSKPSAVDLKLAHSGPWSLRLAELRALKAATLGNSIETTAEYHGKWTAEPEEIGEKSENEAEVKSAGEEPPFTGTIYEGKSTKRLAGLGDKSNDWLEREGFGTEQGSSRHANNESDLERAEVGRKQQSHAKLQPSLDRLNSTQEASERLEASLNRLSTSSNKGEASQPSQKPMVTPDKAQAPTNEDLDLLRASDIRASTRYSRRTKQDYEKTKQEKRQELERGFDSQQKDDHDLSPIFLSTVPEPSKKLSEDISDLRNSVRIRQWLAPKFKPVNRVQDSVDKPSRSSDDKKHEVAVEDITAKSTTQKAIIKPLEIFTPSKEVLDAESEDRARTSALRNATLQRKKLEAEIREQQRNLAEEIKRIYEEVYGPITVDQSQVKGFARIDQLAKEINQAKERAEQYRVKNFIIECQLALRNTRELCDSVKQKLKAMGYSIQFSKSTLTTPKKLIATIPHTTHPPSKETVTAEKPARETGHPPSSYFSAIPSKIPWLYKILAYDSSTLQMTIGETKSASQLQPLHPTEVLSRLNNVAKFLPYFADMEKQGYEIVSGSGDVLVFKKVRSAAESTDSGTSTTISSTATTMPPVSQQTSDPMPSSQNIPATPTDHVSIKSKMSYSDPGTTKVHRQEPLFSGSGQTWHYQDSSSSNSSSSEQQRSASAPPTTTRGWFRRVLLAGTFTAALAYAIGAVAEWATEQERDQDVSSGRRYGSGSGVRRVGIYSTEDSR